MTGFIGTVICVTKAASGPRRPSNPCPGRRRSDVRSSILK
jgi:hypothetical protein